MTTTHNLLPAYRWQSSSCLSTAIFLLSVPVDDRFPRDVAALDRSCSPLARVALLPLLLLLFLSLLLGCCGSAESSLLLFSSAISPRFPLHLGRPKKNSFAHGAALSGTLTSSCEDSRIRVVTVRWCCDDVKPIKPSVSGILRAISLSPVASSLQGVYEITSSPPVCHDTTPNKGESHVSVQCGAY